jgi:tripartite-type tricarboxylate transporter receptor subunit TctC
MTKRHWLKLCVLGLAAAALSPLAIAQLYPQKAIRLLVPWPPGGGADLVGRAVAQALTTQLGQTVFVENVAGAGGNIGTQQFIRAAPDGYTLLLATSSTNAANPHLYKRVGFEPVKDFAPIASVCWITSVMVVAANSPFKTPQDVIDAARAKPGKMSFASGGVGNSAHLAGELFKSITKIDVIHVPYKGSAPALTDVMGGQVDYMLDTGAYAHIAGGKVRALAVAAPQRHPALPNVPTFDELGVKGMVMNAWYGVAGPAGTPQVVIDRVNGAINTALKSGDLASKLANIGAEVQSGTSADFTAFWKSEVDRYATLVKMTGATLD